VIETRQGAVVPSSNGPGQAPEIVPATIPRFQTELPRFFTYAPTLTRNAQGQVTQKEFTVRIAKFNEQQLPSGFPSTPLFGYGGDVFVRYDANGQPQPAIEQTGPTAFVRTSPGPKFEQTRLVPDVTHYRNELAGDHLGPVDPTVDWANPNNFPKPTPPFAPFPPGYPQAQAPITHTTHSHGLEVLPEFDGTPDTWFTINGITGPEYVSNDYSRPNSNQAAPFWYHDHAFGVTRLDVGFGLSGLRDPARSGRRAARSRRATKTFWASRIPTTGSRPWRRSSQGCQHQPPPGPALGVTRGEELRRAARPPVQF
jgi:hypothetical protein